MIFHIDVNSKEPVYTQIEFNLKAAIASGRLQPGDQLPSIREMAVELGINSNTVAKAFKTLELQGFVLGRRGKGIFVTEESVANATRDTSAELRELVELARRKCQAAGLNLDEFVRVSSGESNSL